MKKLVGPYDTSSEEAKGHLDASAPNKGEKPSGTLVSPNDLSDNEKNIHRGK